MENDIYKQKIAFLTEELGRIGTILSDQRAGTGILLTIAGLLSFLPQLIIMNNEYLPIRAVIEKIIVESADAKTFILRPIDKTNHMLKHKPGQFVMLSLAGYGEAPFTYASSPIKDGVFQISVRRVGILTHALHQLKEKDIVEAIVREVEKGQF